MTKAKIGHLLIAWIISFSFFAAFVVSIGLSVEKQNHTMESEYQSGD